MKTALSTSKGEIAGTVRGTDMENCYCEGFIKVMIKELKKTCTQRGDGMITEADVLQSDLPHIIREMENFIKKDEAPEKLCVGCGLSLYKAGFSDSWANHCPICADIHVQFLDEDCLCDGSGEVKGE